MELDWESACGDHCALVCIASLNAVQRKHVCQVWHISEGVEVWIVVLAEAGKTTADLESSHETILRIQDITKSNQTARQRRSTRLSMQARGLL